MWTLAKTVLLIVLVSLASRPTMGISDSTAPVFVCLIIASFAFGLCMIVTPLILRLFPSARKDLGKSLWSDSPFAPVPFAHLFAWFAFAFSTGLVIQCFFGAKISDDLLIPFVASVGAGLGILAGIERLRKWNNEANQQVQPIAGKPGPG